MSKINWGRFIIAGLVAAIICFFTDGLLHERIVGVYWRGVYSNLRIAEPVHSSAAIPYFVIFELGRGLVSMFLYVLMRQRFRPGPTTAAYAGIVAWIAFSVTGPAQFIPLGFYSNILWLKVAAFQFITFILATIAGAALYKETPTS